MVDAEPIMGQLLEPEPAPSLAAAAVAAGYDSATASSMAALPRIGDELALARQLGVGSPSGPPRPGWSPLVYLASGLGFSAAQRATVLPPLVSALEALGVRVFEPFTMNAEGAKTAQEQEPGWAYRIGQADMQAVRDCDAVFCWSNFNPPDEGAMVELGAAIALGKQTFLFRDDFRNCASCEDYPLNLMLFTGLPQEGWREFYYTSVEDVADPSKAFARWASGEAVQ